MHLTYLVRVIVVKCQAIVDYYFGDKPPVCAKLGEVVNRSIISFTSSVKVGRFLKTLDRIYRM